MMLEIAIDSDEDWDSSSSWEELARKAAEAAIAQSAFPQLSRCARPVEISIRLTSDEDVGALNARWRGKTGPTNVLSFPLAGSEELHSADRAGPELLLGDIVLARGVCEREAREKDIAFEDYAVHLMVHGTLHLLGYDHQADSAAADMEARETRALASLGIDNPYRVVD